MCRVCAGGGVTVDLTFFSVTSLLSQTEEVIDIAQQDLALLSEHVERAVDITTRDLSEFAEIVKRVWFPPTSGCCCSGHVRGKAFLRSRSVTLCRLFIACVVHQSFALATIYKELFLSLGACR